jgi:hypothetical protein
MTSRYEPVKDTDFHVKIHAELYMNKDYVLLSNT